MVEDHTGLNNERIDEQAFLDQCDEVWNEREAMMVHELDRFDRGMFYCLYDTPDRVQHLFWRFRDPDHPAHRGKPIDPRWTRVVEATYKRADDAVGSALSRIDDETLLIVLSDHGFNGFRRGFHVNSWLHAEGFLTLKGACRPR